MRPGEVVAGRFEIEAIAGTGGMGTVYRARDLAGGGHVALKTLAGVGEHEARRFAREAAVLADLAHPAIVRYVAHGVAAHQPYLAMEWVDGETLHGRLGHGRLSIVDAIVVGRAVGEALAAAHRRGIVHRDIKPANLILPGGELARVKVLDFGIARHVAHGGQLTNTGTIVGTPGYMAPEQVRGETAIDARTDVFALGCVLYRCIVGASAFAGDESLAVLAKILVDDVAPPSSIVADVPAALDALVLRMLAKARDARPGDGGEVAAELARIAVARATEPTLVGVGIGARVGADVAGGAGGATLAGDATVACGAATASASPQSITATEQRLVSIVLSGPLPEPAAGGEPTRELERVATSFGGRLEQIADGATLVLFARAGVVTDLALRAARCALALRDVLPGVPFVVASGRAALDRLPVGDVIDRAVAALRELSPAQIALDAATADLLDDRFVVTATGARRLLRGTRDDAEPARTLLGRTTAMVGRDRELATIVGLWDECASERVARAVLVTAPPGAGKSRLRVELARQILQRDARAELVVGRGDVVSAGSPFAMLADAIRRAAGVREGDALADQRAHLHARVACSVGERDADRVAHLLGELVGVAFPSDASEALRAARADPIAKGDAMRAAWIDWLAAECAVHPVLLVLEDLHWGDRATVDYVDAALRELADAPLMVLALARPEVHDAFPRLWTERAVQEIRLPALTAKAGEKLVREMLGADAPAATVHQVVERAAGNAFFLEELIRAVAEGRDELPDSVLSVLQQRLDGLPAAARRALRAASVFGEVFWTGGVHALLGSDPRDHLAALVRGELVAPQPRSRLPGEVEYVFRHDLVREAAYVLMSADDRVLGHRLAGDWLVAHGFGDALALAGHFSLGGDGARASEFFLRAAEHALEGNDNDAALRHAARGLACEPALDDERRGALELVRAAAYNWRGEHADAIPAAEAAIAALRRGSGGWFRAQDELFFAAGRMGQLARGMVILHQLTATPAEPGGELDQLRCVSRAAIVMFRFGPPDVGPAVFARVEELASRITIDHALEQRLQTVRSLAARSRGDAATATAAHDAALRSCELAHNLRELAFTYLAYAGHHDELGCPDAALPMIERGLQVAERIGTATVATLLYFQRAMVQFHRGELAEARASALRAVAGCGAQDRAVAGLAHFVLANVALARGDAAAARVDAERAVELLAAFGDYRSFALAARARVHLALGEPAAARADATLAREQLRPQHGFQDGESFVRLVEIEALEAAGDGDGARAATALAIARLDARAARIAEPWRTTFLAKDDNARTLARRGPRGSPG